MAGSLSHWRGLSFSKVTPSSRESAILVCGLFSQSTGSRSHPVVSSILWIFSTTSSQCHQSLVPSNSFFSLSPLQCHLRWQWTLLHPLPFACSSVQLQSSKADMWSSLHPPMYHPRSQWTYLFLVHSLYYYYSYCYYYYTTRTTNNSCVLNFSRNINKLTLDVICTTAFGVDSQVQTMENNQYAENAFLLTNSSEANSTIGEKLRSTMVMFLFCK